MTELALNKALEDKNVNVFSDIKILRDYSSKVCKYHNDIFCSTDHVIKQNILQNEDWNIFLTQASSYLVTLIRYFISEIKAIIQQLRNLQTEQIQKNLHWQILEFLVRMVAQIRLEIALIKTGEVLKVPNHEKEMRLLKSEMNQKKSWLVTSDHDSKSILFSKQDTKKEQALLSKLQDDSSFTCISIRSFTLLYFHFTAFKKQCDHKKRNQITVTKQLIN